MSTGDYNASKTHCLNGHLFDGANTRIDNRGRRCCNACARDRKRRKLATPEGRLHESEKMARWRAANPERNRRNWTENRKRKHEWLVGFKETIGCAYCPERHEACLEFHHIDPTQKDISVALAIARWSIERIQREIEKCIVLCSNCHRKWHWEERRVRAVEERTN